MGFPKTKWFCIILPIHHIHIYIYIAEDTGSTGNSRRQRLFGSCSQKLSSTGQAVGTLLQLEQLHGLHGGTCGKNTDYNILKSDEDLSAIWTGVHVSLFSLELARLSWIRESLEPPEELASSAFFIFTYATKS